MNAGALAGSAARWSRGAERRLLVAGTALLLVFGGLFAGPSPAAAWDANTFSPRAEQQLFALTNQVRIAAGLRPLQWDSVLAGVARWRSEDMIRRDYFSHAIPPSGELVFAVLDARHYCYRVAGENIGWDTYPDGTGTSTIEQLFLDSPTHRAIILGAAWNVIGIGAYQGASAKKIWTVLFADRCLRTPVTPAPGPLPRISQSQTRQRPAPAPPQQRVATCSSGRQRPLSARPT